MSAASCLLSKDRFLCSICLDVFTDPVSTPCGHNFCKSCISQHWDISDRCQCPLCKKVFQTRPELHINTFISDMVSQFRHEAQQKVSSSSSEQQAHDKPLELFCKTDQTCVCMLCCVFDHKTHEFVPLREEYEVKKAELVKTEAEIQQMIIKRLLKIRKIKKSVKMSKDAADRKKAEGVQVFTALKESVDKRMNEFIKEIEDKQESTKKQAEGFITDLEQEISELMKRSSEVEQLSRSKDHLHLLQSFSSLKAAPTTKDWTEVTGVRAVSQLKETLNKEMKKLFEAELKRVQQYAVDVTLDPDTAHPKLILSDDGKQVHCGEEENDLPDNPERFSEFLIVLGKQSLSSGRFYFEVQVKYKTKLMLGVVTESVNRKEKFTVELNRTKGYWIVGVYKNNYIALEGLPEGLVSFHDVDDAALIYSFTGCSFTGKLYPFFCPWNVDDDGKNSAPLIICPSCHKNIIMSK
uniref:Uncharacterized protein n=1 Tax=Maylandia zebra TaxID=106582 RepID=A0A3P9D128_9CICH